MSRQCYLRRLIAFASLVGVTLSSACGTSTSRAAGAVDVVDGAALQASGQPTPTREPLQQEAPVLYAVDAPLLSVEHGEFMACEVIATSLPPAGCTGVPVSGDVGLGRLPRLVTYGNGTVQTGPVHLVGRWDGHALQLTQPPTPAARTTPIGDADCPPPTAQGVAAYERVQQDLGALRARRIDVLLLGACGGDAEIQLAVAEGSTVAYLEARYGPALVRGWLTPWGAGSATPTPSGQP